MLDTGTAPAVEAASVIVTPNGVEAPACGEVMWKPASGAFVGCVEGDAVCTGVTSCGFCPAQIATG